MLLASRTLIDSFRLLMTKHVLDLCQVIRFDPVLFDQGYDHYAPSPLQANTISYLCISSSEILRSLSDSSCRRICSTCCSNVCKQMHDFYFIWDANVGFTASKYSYIGKYLPEIIISIFNISSKTRVPDSDPHLWSWWIRIRIFLFKIPSKSTRVTWKTFWHLNLFFTHQKNTYKPAIWHGYKYNNQRRYYNISQECVIASRRNRT